MRSRSRESEAAAIVLARTLPVRERRSPRPELLASEKKNLAKTGQGLFCARNLGRSRSGNRTLRGWREMRRGNTTWSGWAAGAAVIYDSH